MKQALAIHIILQLLLSCSPKTNSPTTLKDSTPVCILRRIEEIKKQPVWSPPAEVNEYSYNGQTVYLITADCCDQFVTLTDKSCTTLCAPSGGFTGRGDGRCNDFYQKAKLIRLIWKDTRE